jgi:hypothetical protein
VSSQGTNTNTERRVLPKYVHMPVVNGSEFCSPPSMTVSSWYEFSGLYLSIS